MRLTRRTFLQSTAGAAALATSPQSQPAASQTAPATQAERPNILWILGEDMGPDLGCYGDSLVTTPNLDRLAREGIRFNNAFTSAPVCSASRSAMITGMYQTTIDAHHHRSHRGDRYALPEPIRPVTEYFKAAGYYTANVRKIEPGVPGAGKTDFNFLPANPFEGDAWSELKGRQPFFAQVNFQPPHRRWAGARARAKQDNCLVDPAKVELPPYYPDHPITRDDFANYLDAIHLLDVYVGAVLRKLEEDGLAENTMVIFIGDNGRCHERGKQWVYDAGLHIPILVRWPKHFEAGTVSDDLVSAIDIAPTLLALAAIKPPAQMQGKVFLGPDAKKRDAVFAARDRCDETVECQRCVRTKQFAYIRNFRSDLPFMQPNQYKDSSYPVRNLMRRLHAEGKLAPEQELWMVSRKPAEELYDVAADPHQIHNLAASAAHRQALQDLRKSLYAWMDETKDVGLIPEPELLEMAKKYGNGMAAIRHEDNRDLVPRLRVVIECGEQGRTRELLAALKDKQASVRYYAATWLGDLPYVPEAGMSALAEALRDESGAVRVAAARALARNEQADKTLEALVAELRHENIAVRHYAALALEDLGPTARPALEALKAARQDSYDCVKRVAGRAVAKLTGEPLPVEG
jgi:arylsulfatase A-like enzyme